MPIYKTGKSKDGKAQYKVVVSYTDKNGIYKQKSKICYGKDEAKLAEMSLNIQKSAPTTARMTVDELYEKYIAAKAHDVRKTSLEKSKSILVRSVLPKFSNVPVSKLNAASMQDWKNSIAELPTNITTKNNAYCEFNMFLNWAVRMEYIQKNPLRSVGRFKDAYIQKQKKLQYYTIEEFRKYISVAEAMRKNYLDYACVVFFYIAYYTGCRKGEINALRWSDLEGNIIHIRRSVCQKIPGAGVIETPPKNKSSIRDLQIPNRLIKILDEHHAYQRKNFGNDDDYRICGGSDVISDTYLDKHNREYADAAGLHRIRIHDFRHSHATLLCNEGINIQEVAHRLGHSDISMTWNTYSHLYPREEERAVSILDRVKPD